MKKLFTILTMLVLGIGSSWADFVPNANTEYTLQCCSSSGHSSTKFIGISNNQLIGQSSTGARFKFEATTGGYYIKVVDVNKYFNWSNGVADLGETASTVWEFRTSYIDNAIAIAPVGTASGQALNNNGGTNNLKMGPCTSSSNACSHWTITGNCNAYIGGVTTGNYTINETKWKTQGNWSLTDTWKNDHPGPGCPESDMWSPIYLQDITEGTVPELEGWNFRMTADHSSFTISNIKKIQNGGGVSSYLTLKNSSNVTMSFGNGHTYDFCINLNEGSNNNFTFNNINKTYSGQITVNFGEVSTTTNRIFNASGSGSISSLVLKVNLTDPSEDNSVESITLASFTNITVTTPSINISGAEGWVQVYSRDALEAQTVNNKYYYVETTTSGVTLYTFKETRRSQYNVTTDETLSNITDYSDYASFNVSNGVSLTIDIADFDLTKITGTGNIILSANNASIVGNKNTAATGKLTINEGVILTIGGKDNQTNSVASFSSIDLAGQIKNNNSTLTLNNVTVPEGKNGVIFSYDMGNTADGFLLDGTTTVNGNLFVCNRWNFQMKVNELAGNGTWTINGTTSSDYSAGTSSSEDATINVANASTYTGNVTVNNTNATVNLSGNLVGSCWTKTNGTLKYKGNNLNGTTLDGVILAGSERLNLSNTVTIKNLAGNDLSASTNNYAIASSNAACLVLEGTCDFKHKANNSETSFYNISIGNTNGSITIKSGANVSCGKIWWSDDKSNAPITVESGATLESSGAINASTITNNGTVTATGRLYANTITNNGTITALKLQGNAVLGDGTTNLSDSEGITNTITVNGNATLNLSAANITLNQPITIASGKTLTIDGGSNTVNLTGSVSGSGNIVLSYFPIATTHPTLTDWTGTFEFASPASGQADLAAIFNAWGNKNSTIKLHSVTGWLPGTTDGTTGFTVNPTLNILEDATLTINNGSSNTQPLLNTITGAGTLEQTWAASAGSYALHISKLTGFTGTLKGTNKPIVVKKLVIDNAPFVNTRLIKTTGDVTLNKLYIGLEETSAYSWETKTIDEVTGIYVTEIDQVQLYREMAVATVSPYFTYIGAGVGQYTISLGVGKNYTSISDFESAILAWKEITDCSIPILTLNQPTDGFYRFRIDNKYMCGIAGNDNVRTATETNNDASTIFYLNEDNYLISYLDGYGFNYGYCKATSPGIFNNFDFSESTLLTKYNIHSNAGTGDSQWSDRNITINTSDNKLAEGQGTWAIEPVTSLPVTFKKAGLGYATFFTPVALQIPDENTHAYVCKLQESGSNAYTLTFYEITAIKDETDHTTIPANTAVLLYRSGVKDGEEDVVVNFPITTCKDEEGEDVVITENSFYGTLATKSFDPNSTVEDIYSLRTYLKEDQAVKVGFYKKTSGTTCAGFKAWLKTDHPVNNEARIITINFDGDSDPTGIVEALGLEDENVEIYDLNGRKMATYKKGINIVNGKKVLVK